MVNLKQDKEKIKGKAAASVRVQWIETSLQPAKSFGTLDRAVDVTVRLTVFS